MKFLAAAVTMLAALATQTYQKCAGWQKEDLIQSGTVQFRNYRSESQTCHTVNLDFAVPNSGVGVAVSSLDLNRYRPTQGLDYSLRASRKDNSNAIQISLLVENNWSKISASYLASSNPNVIAGSFIADTFQLFGCDKRTSVDRDAIKYSIPHFPKGNYGINTFISGIKSKDARLNVKIWDPKINADGDITVRLTSNADPSIENLYVNYIAWKKGQFNFKTFDPTQGLSGDYNIAGPYGFSNSLVNLSEGVAIFADRLACQGSGCSGTCVTSNICQRIGGQVIDGICYACSSKQNLIGKKCVSNCGRYQYWGNGSCLCNSGYTRHKGICTPCPQYSSYSNGFCKCSSGYWMNENTLICQPEVPSCPPNAKWNQKKLICECQRSNQYLIGGLCRTCGPKEGWNGQQCVCFSDYYKINGACRTCDINSKYNGNTCECNHGFYGDYTKCQRCHSSCGQCKGPGANQCVTCTDVSYTLKNGYCTRDDPCPKGLYLDNKQTCQSCSVYCETCSSQQACNKCIDGFQLVTQYFGNQKISYCTEICGDGRRFEVDCDDGNNRDRDGCNSKCQVQESWTCQKGSSTRPSTCAKLTNSLRSIISTTGTVHLFGRVVQGIRLSYLPPEITANDCALCNKALWVRVIDSSVVPGVRINYLPRSKYQFLCEFEFNGLFAIPVFAISVQINPDYAKYFNKEDLAQIEVKRIDPAVLAKPKQVKTLTVDDIYGDPNKISISDEALQIVTRQ